VRHTTNLIGRRDALVGAAVLTWGCGRSPVAAPIGGLACVLTPEQVEGPYYLDDARFRSDIREGKPGVPLRIALKIVDVRACRPVEGAAVDLWHCDSGGTYSGFAAESARPLPPGAPPPPHAGGPRRPPPGPGFDPRGGPPPAHRGDALTFLRGVQVSDASGTVQFGTIYPGWYPGRAVHIHLKVRTEGTLRGGAYVGGHVAHTGQLYLPEEVSDQVFLLPPYASHEGTRMRQGDDPIFADGGSGGLVELSAPGPDAASGYLAAATVAFDPSATPAVRR
jgi:protocatechuate 3,4-dioxygenase beta subunit